MVDALLNYRFKCELCCFCYEKDALKCLQLNVELLRNAAAAGFFLSSSTLLQNKQDPLQGSLPGKADVLSE